MDPKLAQIYVAERFMDVDLDNRNNLKLCRKSGNLKWELEVNVMGSRHCFSLDNQK